MILSCLLFVFCFAYAIIILCFYYGWKKLLTYNPVKVNSELFVSIVIAARNEEKHIESVIKSVLCQDYPSRNYEIIIVDDHSTDRTYNLAEIIAKSFSNLSIYQLPKGVEGKKKAIFHGVTKAKGELILLTDADVIIPTSWVSAMTGYYEERKTLIVGPVVMDQGNTLFERMQSFEFMSLSGSTAGSASIGHPIMCNGANIAFPKEFYMRAFSAIKPGVASGDDIFLLQSAKKKDGPGVSYLKSPLANIIVSPISKPRDFFAQRFRWTSKSRYYKDFEIILTAIIVFFVNLLLSLAFIASFFHFTLLFPFLLCFAIKSIVDFLFLRQLCIYFETRKLLLLFLPVSFFYIFYISLTGILGNLLSFKWKGRIYEIRS
jgi:poly-beta-1,6-N-acetyl-D-glucosamine synthase